MSQKKYWNNIEDLNKVPDPNEGQGDEFPSDLSEEFTSSKTPRRDFLKYVGFSTLAATVAASCEMPVRKAVPYAILPDADVITPGVANYYASTYVENGEYCSVVVKTRDGRPIMIEGNDKCFITHGSVSARVVASTLSLYDTARLRGPQIKDKQVDTFDELDKKVQSELNSASGQVVLLTGSIISPTSKEVITKFLTKYPNGKHVTFDPVSYSGMLLANEASFGKRALPSYHFDKAKTIFSLGCDFLGSWLSPIEFTYGYSQKRKMSAANPEMSKHYQVEGMLSMTGANADKRATCKPSEYGKVAVALLQALSGTAPNFASKTLNTLIQNAAKDLQSGNGLVVCGVNDSNVQQIVNAINSAIGAYGTTISWAVDAYYKQGIDQDMATLVKDMQSGSVGAIIVSGVNPAYEYYDSKAFTEGLKKVKTTISLNDRLDETTELCTYKMPTHHWLESWGDAEPKTGYYSLIQPTISPLYKTRQYQDSLLKWSGETTTYLDLFNAFWIAKVGDQKKFNETLQSGVLQTGEVPISGGSGAAAPDAAISTVNNIKGGEYEVVVYESVSIGHGGAFSNNPWLQELPDPVTKATWDNYVMMSPNTAKKFNARLTGLNQVETEKRVVKVTVGKNDVKLPVVVVPGMHDQVIAVALGYGRSKKVGMAAANLGKNAYSLVTYDNNNFVYNNVAKIAETSEKYKVAITQTHLSSEARSIIKEYTLDEFKKDPMQLINKRREDLSHYTQKPWEHHEFEKLKSSDEFDARAFEKEYASNGTLYPQFEKKGIHWGMSIDLNSCTGCSACVIACQSENNVSVVGKDEVLKAHEMSWLRIDRYFSGDPNDADSIQMIFQPMLCQHCDNAPCENVCPVSATNHSSEGLNQMAYNRCIGTKYCANNCPYKVRRFNWFDFNGADSFSDNLYADGRRDAVNDEIMRMVLNPDVTVRSRGVMEKCSFCVQRLQAGKLQAKTEGTPLQDRHVKTACQMACPSNSITFGNINDTSSRIYKERYLENKERLFYVLEELHTLPNVSYLSKIRNTDEIITGSDKDGLYKEHI